MSKKAIIPQAMKSLYREWRMSPGLECGGFVFLTGFNGVRLDGTLSTDAPEQIQEAFAPVQMVLEEGGLSFGDVVEVTSYHVGFAATWSNSRRFGRSLCVSRVSAWTAIEVAGFASESVIVELRVVARRSV